jgi:hypothetical protein
MTTNGNGSTPPAALKMAASIEDSLERGGQGSRVSFYFDAKGKPLVAGGRNFGQGNRSTRNGTLDLQRSMKATFVIEYPHRPSIASLSDMVTDHERTGRRVVYDAERWENDKRVDEQIAALAGDDPVVDWRLEALIDKLEEREEIAA